MSNTAVNTDLLLTFFLTFSKFEHALKASGFFKKPRNGNYNSQRPTPAEPDWDSFAVSLRKCFAANRKEKLAMACDYLLLSPPKNQVIIRVGQKWYIAWEPPARSQNETDIEFLLKMIRGIRNNRFIPADAGNILFHSLKFPCITVHPRGCGEHDHLCYPPRRSIGSSPRMRGT